MNKHWLLCLIALCFSLMTQALEPFTTAQLQQDEQQQVNNYRLVLANLSRVQASTVPDHEVRLQGELWRRTWSVDAQFSLAEVVDYYKDQFAGLQTLYECRALDCSSNNFWANNIFNNARLVGRDQFQYYRVALKQEAQQSTLYVLYVVQRGTKQIMVNLDVLSSPQRFKLDLNTPAYIRQQLKSQTGWLAGFETDQGHLHAQRSQALLQELKQLPAVYRAKLYLVVHCYTGEQMAQTQQCSEQLAAELQQQLGKEFHILAQGASVLAPDAQPSALRFIYWPQR